MEKSKLILYQGEDIITNAALIRHNNAFILGDGSFYVAKGYTGCNPSHQLESSALAVGRQDIGEDFREEYNDYMANLIANKASDEEVKRVFYLRSILVHYYGYALFARTEVIRSYQDRNRFFDESLVPNPEYYGRDVTLKQIATLEKLFELNNDETLILHKSYNDSSEDILKKVLSYEANSWHR